MTEVLSVMWWELVQNVPLVFGFVLAFSFWQRNLLAALGCMIVSSIIAALFIAATEGKIFEGHRDTIRAVIANAIIFSLLMVVTALYLSAGWSSWATDIACGFVVTLVLAVVQDWAAEDRFGFVRSLYLGVSGAVSLIVIRLVGGIWGAVIAVVWFTLVMGAYKQWWRKPRRETA